MTDTFYRRLGLCRRSGKLLLGADTIQKTGATVHAAFLASDASDRVDRLCRKKTERVFVLDRSKAELGHLLGCHEVAAAAVCDKRFAEALLQSFEGE